jgi:hypothetical protein
LPENLIYGKIKGGEFSLNGSTLTNKTVENSTLSDSNIIANDNYTEYGEAPYMATRYDMGTGNMIPLAERVGFVEWKKLRPARRVGTVTRRCKDGSGK